jgi:hypothetical protein
MGEAPVSQSVRVKLALLQNALELKCSREPWDGDFNCGDVGCGVSTRPSNVDLGLDAVGNSQTGSWSVFFRVIYWVHYEYGIGAAGPIHDCVRSRNSQLCLLRSCVAQNLPLGNSAFACRIPARTYWNCESKCAAVASSSCRVRYAGLLVRRCL